MEITPKDENCLTLPLACSTSDNRYQWRQQLLRTNPKIITQRHPRRGCYFTHKPSVQVTYQTLTANWASIPRTDCCAIWWCYRKSDCLQWKPINQRNPLTIATQLWHTQSHRITSYNIDIASSNNPFPFTTLMSPFTQQSFRAWKEPRQNAILRYKPSSLNNPC